MHLSHVSMSSIMVIALFRGYIAPSVKQRKPFALYSHLMCIHGSSSTDCSIAAAPILSKESRLEWLANARNHSSTMNDLLYPKLDKNKFGSLKERMHAVSDHPVYNFLHTYYRYSKIDLILFSPGINCILEDVANEDIDKHVSSRFLVSNADGYFYQYPSRDAKAQDIPTRYLRDSLDRNLNILSATYSRQPYFGCFGLHEWAMVYRPKASEEKKNHQNLPFRVSQKTINDVVESGGLKCSHYDAWRFFDASAQPMNVNPVITRGDLEKLEQPGCVHSNMDLFKYAYQLYPLLPSTLLVETLQLALAARMIDMRASPYDVSGFDGCEDPLMVETMEGRRRYALEQEALFRKAMPLRRKLIDAYNAVLEHS